ncbi:MAG: DinB family protein [Acidobacteria bacterium]|nr:DinB family protein [Acidobacteriota bacterium]
MPRPDPSEHAPYFSTYIDKVPGDDPLLVLGTQLAESIALLDRIGEARASLPYAPGKWTVKQTVGHLIDTERVWAYRALRFARNDMTPLAGFEQDGFARNAPFDRYSLRELIEEWMAVRAASVMLFSKLNDEEWSRTGSASGSPCSVRALAFMMAGHEIHHRRLLSAA